MVLLYKFAYLNDQHFFGQPSLSDFFRLQLMHMVYNAFFLISQALLVLEKVTKYRLKLVYFRLKSLKISLLFLVSELKHVNTKDHLVTSFRELSSTQSFLVKFFRHFVVLEHMVIKEPLKEKRQFFVKKIVLTIICANLFQNLFTFDALIKQVTVANRDTVVEV